MVPLLILAALMAIFFYIYQLSKRVQLGFASLLAVSLYSFTFGTSQGLLGAIHIDPVDIVSICILCAGIIRTARSMNQLTASRLIAFGYIALLVFGIIRGLAMYDMKTVMNESRAYVGSMAGMLYFLTAPIDQKSMRRYVWMYIWFGLGLCVVASLATAGLNVGATAWAHVDSSDMGISGRALPSGAAAAIALCAFLALGYLRSRKSGLAYRVLPSIFLVFAIYLRHRTVWMMLVAGFAILPLLDGKLFKRMLPLGAIAAVLFLGILIFGKDAQVGVSSEAFSTSAQDQSTLIWRINGWKELLADEEQTAFTVLAGKEMGGGYYRIDELSGASLDLPPHNDYIFRYLRVGVLGTVLVLLFMLRPLWGLWKLSRFDKDAIYPSTPTWPIVILMIAVYGVPYTIEAHAYAILGIANALISDPRREWLTGGDRNEPAIEYTDLHALAS